MRILTGLKFGRGRSVLARLELGSWRHPHTSLELGLRRIAVAGYEAA
jgi:hypothetical protein